MRMFSLGLIGGIAGASLAFSLYLVPQEGKMLDVIAPQTVEAESDLSATRANFPRLSAPSSAGEQLTQPAQSIEDYESIESRLSREFAQAQRLANEIGRKLEELRVAKELADDPIVFPLTLPDELSWVLSDTNGQYFHGLVQREYRDEAWAGPLEQKLRTFFAERTEIVERFGFPTITCRTTICEVSVVGYGADERFESVAFQAYSDLIREMRGEFNLVPGENLPGQLPESYWLGQRLEDGIGTMFWSLPRKE